MTEYICPDCHNRFLQPFRCTTCGAQKLYGATLAAVTVDRDEAAAEAARLRAENERLKREVAALRLSLGERPGAIIPEPIGCPCPGACSTVAEIERLRQENEDLSREWDPVAEALAGDFKAADLGTPIDYVNELLETIERLTTDKRRCHAILSDVYASVSGEDDEYDWAEVLRELDGCESGKCTDKCDAEFAMLMAEVERLRGELAAAERERCGAEYLGRVCTLASGHPPAGVVLWHIGVDGVPWTEHIEKA